MILDRLETLAAINFVKQAISKNSEKNCLFVQVDEGKLILVGADQYLIKRAVLIGENTTDNGKELPKTFMIPISKLLAFETMMKEDKAKCKKLAKNDPSYMHVSIDDKTLESYEGFVHYEQPAHEFVDHQAVFQVTKGQISEIPIMSGEMKDAMEGFKKSEKVEVVFTGHMQPIYFGQGDYEAILIPPIEKEESDDNGEQQEF